MSSPFNVNMSQLGQVFQLFDSGNKGGNGDGRLSYAEAKKAADTAKEGTSIKALLTAITKDQTTFDKFAASIDDEKKNYVRDGNGNLIVQNGRYVVDENQTTGFNASIMDFQKYAGNGFNIVAGAFDAYPDLLTVKNDIGATNITVTYNASTPISDLFNTSVISPTPPYAPPTTPSTTPSPTDFLGSFLPILLRLLFGQMGGGGYGGMPPGGGYGGMPIGGGYGTPTGSGGINPLTLLFLLMSQARGQEQTY